MQKKLKFSVITPSFNQAQFLETTINSVLDQDYQPYEYFVMDGGSADDSVKVIKKYAKKLIWQSRKDFGQAHAINKGFKKAHGDIMAFINSDDYYLPNAFEQVANYFESHPDCQWLVGDCLVSDPKLSWTFSLKQMVPYDRFPYLLYLFNFINQPVVFLRRDLVKKVGEFDQSLRYAFDYDYWLRCLKFSPPHRLRLALAVFRVHDGSKGSLAFKQQFAEDYRVVQKYAKNSIILVIHWLIDKAVATAYEILKKASS